MPTDKDLKGIRAIGQRGDGTFEANKSRTVAVQHTKLPDRATVDRMKTYWSDRLDALVAVLSG